MPPLLSLAAERNATASNPTLAVPTSRLGDDPQPSSVPDAPEQSWRKLLTVGHVPTQRLLLVLRVPPSSRVPDNLYVPVIQAVLDLYHDVPHARFAMKIVTVPRVEDRSSANTRTPLLDADAIVQLECLGQIP